MTEWLLSITGIILLSVLCEFVLPEGQINRYIRGIFAFFTIFVIISPLPKILNLDIDFSNYLSSYNIELQEDYLNEINRSKLDAYLKDINLSLQEKGIKNVKIMVKTDEKNIKIYEILVDLREMSFSDSGLNKESVKEIIIEEIENIQKFKNKNVVFQE